MNECPKCGSLHIIGPTYDRGSAYSDFTKHERLRYTCARCGYTSTMPTLDQQKRNEASQS